VIKIIVDALLNPLLSLPDWLAILIFATIIIIIINLIYKFTLDQKKVSEIKTRMKELQKKSKDAPNEEKMKYLNEMTSINSKYMKMTLKPMLITFLIISILLPWLNVSYGDKVGITNGTEGWVLIGNNNITFSVLENGISMNNKTINFGENINIENKKYVILKEKKNKIKFSRIILESPIPLPITGKNWGWLAYYFVLSIPLSIVLRKLMGVKM